jgi:collagen type III alpha
MRRELPDGYKHVVQGPPLPVVGESFHRDAIERVVGRRPEGHYAIVDAAIALNPENPVDPEAVAIWIGGQLCGHLSRADAAKWRPVLGWYAERGIVPVARGDVLGGWRQSDGTWADFGITLYVATPEDLSQRQRAGTEG